MGLFTDTLASAPDKSVFSMFPANIDDWTCPMWQQYFFNLTKRYRLETAKYYWNNDASRIGTFGSSHLCSQDSKFMSWVSTMGLDFPKLFLISDFVTTTESTTSSIENVATNVSKGAENISKGVKWVLPTLLIGGTVIYLASRFGIAQKARNQYRALTR